MPDPVPRPPHTPADDMKRAWKARREMKQSGVSLWAHVRDVPPHAAEAHLENTVLLHEVGGLDRLASSPAGSLASVSG